MEKHFILSDNQFERQFELGELDPEIFSHEAHLRLAWIHVRKYGVEKAIENVCDQLFRYVDTVGAIAKYNKTLTIAAVRAVNHFINKSVSSSFFNFIQEFPRLKNNFREIIGCHYSQDIFKSELAKQEYLEPDILPFT